MKARHLSTSLTSGLGLALALLWLLGNPSLSGPFVVMAQPGTGSIRAATTGSQATAVYSDVQTGADATRYVSPTGTDGGDCTTTSCATISYALSQSSDGDTIEVSAGVYTESGIQVNDDVTIRGQGADQTIVQAHANPGQAGDRGFKIGFAAVAIRDMTIRHGRTTTTGGGGIYNDGSVTLTNVIVCCNSANGDGGGIANAYGSTLTLNDTSIVSNTTSSAFGGGGGISVGSNGTATLVRSTVSSNTVQGTGGGIYNGLNCNLMMTDTTISGNTATGDGGGIDNGGHARIVRSTISGNHSDGYGGGVGTSNLTEIINSTISDNTANQNGGGIYAGDSSTTLNNSTVVSNTADADGNSSGRGGGVNAFDGDIDLKSTIIVANRRGTTADDCYHNPLGLGGISSYGYNLVGSGTGCPTSYASDKTTANPAAELDLTLADNGGATKTHALVLLDSQAAESGDCNPLGFNPAITQDQRAWPRPVDHDNDGDAKCDTGAFELQSIVMEISPTLGNALSYVDTQRMTTTIEAPSNAVSSTTTLVYTPLDSPAHGPPADFSLAGHAFTLEAYVGGNLQASFTFSQPVTVTLHYSDADVAEMDEASLTLDYWDGNQWVDAATTCTPASVYDRHPNDNWLAVSICHLSEFALFGSGGPHVYLPTVLKNYKP